MNKKEKILLVEPHPDDIVYSMGGTLCSMQKQECDIVVLCVFSESIQSDIRKSESIEVFQGMNNIKIKFLKFLDFSERRSNDIQLFFDVRKEIDSQIDLFRPDKIYGPSGIGQHPDHKIVNMILSGLNDQHVYFYEDFPYCYDLEYEYNEYLNEKYNDNNFQEILVDISVHMEKKINLHRLYTSQCNENEGVTKEKLIYQGSQVKSKAHFYRYEQLSGDYYERFWKKV